MNCGFFFCSKTLTNRRTRTDTKSCDPCLAGDICTQVYTLLRLMYTLLYSAWNICMSTVYDSLEWNMLNFGDLAELTFAHVVKWEG